jgi:hypothetical protein
VSHTGKHTVSVIFHLNNNHSIGFNILFTFNRFRYFFYLFKINYGSLRNSLFLLLYFFCSYLFRCTASLSEEGFSRNICVFCHSNKHEAHMDTNIQENGVATISTQHYRFIRIIDSSQEEL